MSTPLPPTMPRTATFAARPCLCCKGHTPIPLQVELHHIWPQYDQIALYGALHDRETVPLCRTAHRNLHIFLTALMAGKEPPHVNAYTARLVREGLRRIVEAHEAAGVPVPPGGGGE